MHTTYTSGAARRNALDDARRQANGMFTDLVVADVNATHDAAGRINPILDYFRDDAYPGSPDMHYYASEYLYALAHHWAEWQSPRIGTFPLDVQSYAGPATREESEESGEDRAYWYIWDALTGQGDGDRVQDYIVHATAVIGRLYSMSGGDDKGRPKSAKPAH